MRHHLILLAILGVDVFILLFEASELSIGYHEVQFLNTSSSILKSIIDTIFVYFERNDFNIRLVMIVMHTFSAYIVYLISCKYLQKRDDSLWVTGIYVLLPGIQSAALLIDPAGLVLLLLLVYIYLYEKNIYIHYLLLTSYLFIDSSFANLYLGVFVYALIRKNNNMALYTLLLFSISMYYFGIDDGGKPSGYFLDNFGIYFAIFSPIIFVYLVYTLYRRIILKEYDIILAISSTALILSLLFSFRQQISIESFAPFLIIAIILMAQTFLHSYRVRLKVFRKNYQRLFTIALAILAFNAFILLFNKALYLFIDDPKRLFTYRMHVVKELSLQLKEHGVTCINLDDKKYQERLAFYGINKCSSNDNITYSNAKNNEKVFLTVTVVYYSKKVYELNVSKMHRK